jgi:hypothetical protein
MSKACRHQSLAPGIDLAAVVQPPVGVHLSRGQMVRNLNRHRLQTELPGSEPECVTDDHAVYVGYDGTRQPNP